LINIFSEDQKLIKKSDL